MTIFNNLKIKNQLFLMIVLTIIMSMLIIILSYKQFTLKFMEQNRDHAIQTINQIQKNVETNWEIVKRTLYNIEYNEDVQHYLLETDPYKKNDFMNEALKTATNIKYLVDGIVDIVVIDKEGNYFDLKGGAEILQNVYLPDVEERDIYFSGMFNFKYISYNKQCFVIKKNTYSVIPNNKTNEIIGEIMLIIDVDKISGDISFFPKNNRSAIQLVDKNNVIFYSSNEENIGKIYEKQDRKDYDVQFVELGMLGGQVISIISRNEMLNDAAEIREIGLLFLSIELILLFILFSILLRNILNPIRKLYGFITDIKKGNLKKLKQRIQVTGYLEINMLVSEFNNMLDEINGLTHRLVDTTTRLYEVELSQKQAQLAHLQSQINPHFLYNTLETIKGIAVEKHVAPIVGMVNDLGKVLRYSIKGGDYVSLEEELSIAKAYVNIQKARFKDRFSIEYDFAEKTLSTAVPKMILQPLIENSIFHGLEPLDGEGILYIGGDIIGNEMMVIWVRDNGIGISKEVLESINDSMVGQSTGIGLKNVNNRIQLLYSKDYGLTIRSIDGQGTEITITLPTIPS